MGEAAFLDFYTSNDKPASCLLISDELPFPVVNPEKAALMITYLVLTMCQELF